MQAWASKVRAGKGSKGDRLGIVDHAIINYPPFRKNFYIEVLRGQMLYRNSLFAVEKTPMQPLQEKAVDVF